MTHFNFGPLHFQASTLTLVLISVALILGLVLCITAVSRSQRPRRTGTLEVLRFLCILIACTLLLGPEWRTIQSSDAQPEIAILWDESRSMTTEDALLPEYLTEKPTVVTRADLVQQLLETEFWTDLADEGANRITQQSFGQAPSAEASAAERAMAGTDLNAALLDVAENAGNLRAVILLGDGDWNQGKPPVSAAQKLRLRGAPLFALPTGSERKLPDLNLESVNAPTYGIVGENVQIPFTIESSLAREVRTIVRIKSESGLEKTKDITIPANGTHYDSILWRIEKEGVVQLTLSLPVANGELLTTNNERSFTMNGKPENIRVLVIESTPRWEYRFIRNALARDPGVSIDCLLLHPQLGIGDGPDYISAFPEKLEDLQKYDVVFIGDIGIGPNGLTAEQADLIKGLVENQASGVVFIPGAAGNQFSLTESALSDLIPVELDETQKEGFSDRTPSPMRLTTEGQKSLLTMLGDDEAQNEIIWQNLPGFYWQAPVIRAKAGSKVLAVNDNRRNASGRIPILVTSRAGSGKVLYMATDSAWRWRRGVEDLYHYRFWGQVTRWMSYQRNMAAGERVRLYFSPERPKPGEQIFLTANAFAENGAPLQDGKVLLDLTAPDGSQQRIELKQDNSVWGGYRGTFPVDQPGTWLLKTFVAGEPGASVEAKIISQQDEIEKTGLPVRTDVLKEITQVSRGAVVTVNELGNLVEKINALPEPQPLVSSMKLWAHWLTPTILISLLGLFWMGRKLNGTF